MTRDGRRAATRRLLWLVVLALSGCKQPEGGACAESDACAEALSCVTWNEDLEQVLAPCEGDRCCVSADKQQKAEERGVRREKKRARRARIKQCNRLVEVINRHAGSLSGDVPTGDDALDQVAQRVDAARAEVEKVSLEDAELKAQRQRYVAFAEKVAEAARAASAAVAKEDVPALTEATSRLTTASAEEAEVVDAINEYCQGDKPADAP